MKAIWRGHVIAESDKTINIEGNEYFPPESINSEYFRKSDFHTVYPWKGVAAYYDIIINGDTNESAAWYYPDTKPAAIELNKSIYKLKMKKEWKTSEITKKNIDLFNALNIVYLN